MKASDWGTGKWLGVQAPPRPSLASAGAVASLRGLCRSSSQAGGMLLWRGRPWGWGTSCVGRRLLETSAKPSRRRVGIEGPAGLRGQLGATTGVVWDPQ